MRNKDLEKLTCELAKFAISRDWDKFHSPKNLSMDLSGEVGELLEVFQWLTEKESENLSLEQRRRVEEEVADIFLYLLRLSDKLNIDLLEVSHRKLEINESKYPINKCFGKAKKYTDL
ncbi:TPA: nucleotide pyrophosphohydrolase [Vibrio diabolicus]